jgi:hypothetical protein
MVGQLVEMHAARVRIAVYILDHDLGLLSLLQRKAGTHLQRIKLRPKISLSLAFHEAPPIWKNND